MFEDRTKISLTSLCVENAIKEACPHWRGRCIARRQGVWPGGGKAACHLIKPNAVGFYYLISGERCQWAANELRLFTGKLEAKRRRDFRCPCEKLFLQVCVSVCMRMMWVCDDVCVYVWVYVCAVNRICLLRRRFVDGIINALLWQRSNNNSNNDSLLTRSLPGTFGFRFLKFFFLIWAQAFPVFLALPLSIWLPRVPQENWKAKCNFDWQAAKRQKNLWKMELNWTEGRREKPQLSHTHTHTLCNASWSFHLLVIFFNFLLFFWEFCEQLLKSFVEDTLAVGVKRSKSEEWKGVKGERKRVKKEKGKERKRESERKPKKWAERAWGKWKENQLKSNSKTYIQI